MILFCSFLSLAYLIANVQMLCLIKLLRFRISIQIVNEHVIIELIASQQNGAMLSHSITKTCLFNFDPLKPHFYIVKLGLQGYKLFSLSLLKNIDCRYSLEPPRRGGSNEYPQSMF